MKRLLAILFLIPQLVWGAHDYNGTTGYASSGVVEISGEPFSVSCWSRADNDTAAHAVFGISDTAVDTTYFSIFMTGTVGGDPILVRSRNTASGAADAATTSGFSANVWHHVAGVWTSSTSRTAYIDGGNTATNTDSRAVTGIDTTSFGAFILLAGPQLFMDGKTAECGIYNVALSADEVATLAKGFAPPCVRRASLLAYYPMLRDATTLKDLFSATANNLTLAGTTAVADHPRVINCQ